MNKKNDLLGHLRNHHENHVDIEQLNIEALSNLHANARTNKIVCKAKDKSGAEVDAAEKDSESRVKVNIDVDINFRKRKSLHSDSENCISNMKWDNCTKQFSCINTVSLEQLMLPEELRQTADTIAELEE